MYDYMWKRMTIGLAVRYGNFIIGSDRFSNILGINNISGMDVYFGLRFSMSKNIGTTFIKGYCDPYKDRNIKTFDYRQYRNRW